MPSVDRQPSASERRLDEIDQQVIYGLMIDARSNSPPTLAETIGVSPGTVRNRIDALEEDGIIEGYHAHVDFERAGRRLSALFMCNVPFDERQPASRAATAIPGVINVRMLMGGRRNFHVLAVGEDTADLRRIATTLSEGGIEIEDEMLVEREDVRAYGPFGSKDAVQRDSVSDLIGFEEDSEVVTVRVASDAPIATTTISQAVERDILDDDPLIIALTRDAEMLTPHGDTRVQPDDIVTLFSCGGVTDETLRAFVGSGHGD